MSIGAQYDATLSHPGTKRISPPGCELTCPKCQWSSRHHEFFSPFGVCNCCAKYMRPSELAKMKREVVGLKRSLKQLRVEHETELISGRLNRYSEETTIKGGND